MKKSQAFRVLIVEEEFLIAYTLQRYLAEEGYEVVGTAFSLEEAKALFRQEKPDLVLLDIQIGETETGIDFALFIQKQPNPALYIYLTSQLDTHTINHAQRTFPAGYLSKPIRKEDLFAAVEIAKRNGPHPKTKSDFVTFHNRSGSLRIPTNDILFLQADHVKVRVYLKDGRRTVQRGSLRDLLAKLQAGRFVQTHRSFAVNIQHVSRWDQRQVYVGERAIPLSRWRRKKVVALLKGD